MCEGAVALGIFFPATSERVADMSIARQVAWGFQTLATLLAGKSIALSMLFELEQEREEAFEIEKKRQRTTWMRSWCARSEKSRRLFHHLSRNGSRQRCVAG